MKKYYLPLMCVGLLSNALLSQNTYVTGNVNVKVQPNTLFYHGSDFVITDDVTDDAVIKNEGNIKIIGNFTNSAGNGTDGGNFVNLWTAVNNYGQVIINQSSASDGMLTMEKKAINPAEFSWGQFAIPFTFSTVKEAFETIFPGVTYQAGTRYNHSIMTWDNITRPEYDHIAPTVAINPTDYVILNLTTHPALMAHMDSGDPVLQHAGTPANAAYSVAYKPAMYKDVSVPWSTWQTQKNIYNERYSTYIEEHLRVPNSDHHGRYYFQFGNPYTSNIDLSHIGTNAVPGDTDGVYVADLLGVVKISSMFWDSTNGVDVEGVGMIRATYNSATNQWGGNPDALIVRPFEGFYIALNSTASRTDRTFTFNEGLKTFSNVPSGVVGADPGDVLGKSIETSSDEVSAEDRSLNSTSLSVISINSRKSFYQLGLNLFTEDGVQTGNTVYIIVDSNSKTGADQALESDYTDFQKGFFLTQEKSDGSEITTPNRVMQINAVHPKYVSKPIQMFFKKGTQDMNGYVLKADLFYKNIFNKLKMEEVNFADGNSFFFYDKAQDVLLPITTDFSYYIERPEETLSSRYVVYWNGGPVSADKRNVSDELAGSTQVYKDGDVHKIRFDESWESADISVYDLAGRAVFKKEGVKTDVDYVLDLPNTLVYVVKMQSNTGETVTQKIVR